MSRTGICLVSGIYPPESGGPAKFTFEFSQWLTERNIANLTITLTDFDSTTSRNGISTLIQISRATNLVKRYAKTALAIRRGASKKTPILAAGMFIETFIATRFSRLRYIAKVPGDFVWERARNNGYTDLDIESFQKTQLNFRYRIFRFIASHALRKAHRVIVPTRQLESLCIRWGVSANKIHYIPNSVETSIFRPSQNKKSIDVISVCRLVKWKGIEELIATAHELGLTLAIAGDGPERKNLEEYSAQHNAQVNFLGQLSQCDLVNLYHQARYFVLNSSYEGLSHALLEARASGLFCIARAQTGSEDVIYHREDGLLCGTKEFPTLKSTLEFAEKNPKFTEQCIEKSLKRTRDFFDRDTNFEKIRSLVYGSQS